MEKEPLQISLAAARVNAGLTQEAVAQKLCVSKNKVINWEKGKTEIKPHELGYLCSLYNISEEYIFLPFDTTLS